MLLHYDYQAHPTSIEPTIVLIHGLFGSLTNLGILGRHFAQTHSVIQLDVRNHGQSGHSESLNYEAMASDVLETLQSLNIEKFIVIGHSMGGKIAMKLADLARDAVQKLIVLDMAPVQYLQRHHDNIFKALKAVAEQKPNSRTEATVIMREFIQEDMVIQFLMKSFNKGEWRFNVDALYEHYDDILNWEEILPVDTPALFLRGGLSHYVSKPEYFEAIQRQFKQSKIEVIEGTGHWLHAEKPQDVIRHIEEFLKN
ncbi:acyl-CoA esterase [Acinetobacter sp. NCu2D-2]|uniref:alpha/beta fold hydrolase n=1 Tax=Acinetobacter sp. NCu2D-2 TaxID=1608473 RepID=UPI0007CDADB5|nr:alpha/beta fold hydrolase [Acinetobacter sp. NCu2D-2]ANF81761.1 acyl-CoA esterase [Acinetobacter sp. NCu2D-2]